MCITLVRSLLIVGALLATGCMGALNTGNGNEQNSAPDLCKDRRCERAPLWETGDSWSYTLNGSAERQLNYRVVGMANVTGGVTYVVKTNEFIPDGSETRYYNTTTLRQVWDTCGERFGTNCRGERQEFDFPLWDGKQWTTLTGGDAVSTQNVSVKLLDGATPRWEITRIPGRVCYGSCRSVDIYDPEIRFLSERLDYGQNGELVREWRLSASSRTP